MSNKITIHLTDRPPVTIDTDKWDLIADAKDWDGQYDFQAFRKWYIRVRQHEDGRTLVYGWYDTHYPKECNLYAGYLIPDGDTDKIVQAVHDVGEQIEMQACCTNACIADLPAEELV